MIITRVPLRVSLFGGGTDMPEYFEKSKGTVTGFTINRYIYILASKIHIAQGFKYRLSYKENQDAKSFEEISHPLFREILKSNNFNHSYHFSTMSDLPSGTGLGSSSAFAVGFQELLNKILGNKDSSISLAKKAINIERSILCESGGWQDQLHPAYGGFNTFDFYPGGIIECNPVKLSSSELDLLNNHIYLLFSGDIRKAKVIESSKKKNLNYTLLDETYKLAKEGEEILRSGNFKLEEIGDLLNIGWNLKRNMSKKVSNIHIDNLYKLILDKGAYGAKLCGAGGGGFFMFLASKSVMKAIKLALNNNGSISKIKLDYSGLVNNEI